jgi:hypothetical protein
MSEITFAASIVRVKTLVDGGIRVELDLSEDCIPQMAMLAEARREGIPLIFRAEVEGSKPVSRKGIRHDRQSD